VIAEDFNHMLTTKTVKDDPANQAFTSNLIHSRQILDSSGTVPIFHKIIPTRTDTAGSTRVDNERKLVGDDGIESTPNNGMKAPERFESLLHNLIPSFSKVDRSR
jgi:hypothetical protein